jgi:membrane protein implicated in regulation of membrane protease activity
MGMEAIEFVYYVCFFLGFGFAVLSGLLSGVFSGGAEAHVDAGGAHVDVSQAHGGEGPVHFPILSPVTLSMFVATFGGAGIVYKKFLHLPAAGHIPLAGITAVLVALLVAWIFYKLFSITQSSSEGSAEEVIGMTAEITVPIPNDGLGEIAYTLRDRRVTNPARTVDGKELPAHLQVKIVKLVGNTYVVQKAP